MDQGEQERIMEEVKEQWGNKNTKQQFQLEEKTSVLRELLSSASSLTPGIMGFLLPSLPKQNLLNSKTSKVPTVPLPYGYGGCWINTQVQPVARLNTYSRETRHTIHTWQQHDRTHRANWTQTRFMPTGTPIAKSSSSSPAHQDWSSLVKKHTYTHTLYIHMHATFMNLKY